MPRAAAVPAHAVTGTPVHRLRLRVTIRAWLHTQGVALVVDAEVTSYLMMGALSPALKRHSVTLFEGASVCRSALCLGGASVLSPGGLAAALRGLSSLLRHVCVIPTTAAGKHHACPGWQTGIGRHASSQS